MSADADLREGTRFGRPVLVAIVLGLLAMWGYVLYLALFEGRAESPDRIGDTESAAEATNAASLGFTAAAEDRCAEALALVDDLPGAEERRDAPLARADDVEIATHECAAMVDDLRRLSQQIVHAGDADLVEAWLDEWEILLDDRRGFVERLRTEGEDARFLVTAGPSGRQITLRIDEFASANDMISCRSPGDA